MAKLIRLQHKSPLGSLFIAGVGDVPANTAFEVPADVAEQLLQQSDLYATTTKKLPGEKSA